MRKILVSASTVSHLVNFHLPYLKALTERGYEIHAAVDQQVQIPYVTKVFAVPFCKKISSLHNFKAVSVICRLIKRERYDLVVTNTSLAGAVVRCALLLSRERPAIIHFAHGYLFGEKFSLKNRFYLLIEKIVSRITDYLVVMNREDELMANTHHLFKNELCYINGMGVDIKKFTVPNTVERERLRNKYYIGSDKFVFTFAGEFSSRKNQGLLINAFSEMRLPNLLLILPGDGALLNECKEMVANYGMSDEILFPGYSNEIREWFWLSDAAISSSRVEGLPFNILEAMACGLPIIASDIKGHRELVTNDLNGYLFESDNVEAVKTAVMSIYNSPRDVITEKGIRSRELAEHFSLESVFESVMEVYRKALEWSEQVVEKHKESRC